MNDNKLIAEFMGWDIESPTTIPSNLRLSNLELDNGEILEYDFSVSWDWLMPVILKIEMQNELISAHILSTDIDATYRAVIKFIKGEIK